MWAARIDGYLDGVPLLKLTEVTCGETSEHFLVTEVDQESPTAVYPGLSFHKDSMVSGYTPASLGRTKHDALRLLLDVWQRRAEEAKKALSKCRASVDLLSSQIKEYES
jgi:hypothetical protein